MSLRKSPCLTTALLAANRRNAKKFAGPRTARGKAWSRLNHLRNGWRSPEYLRLVTALVNAPPGRVEATAQAFLSSKMAIHPLFAEFTEIAAQTEIKKGNQRRWRRAGRDDREKRILFYTFEAGMSMKTNDRMTICPRKKRHLYTTFGHLTQTNRYFAEFCRRRQLFCPFLSDTE